MLKPGTWLQRNNSASFNNKKLMLVLKRVDFDRYLLLYPSGKTLVVVINEDFWIEIK